jgi:transcription factor E
MLFMKEKILRELIVSIAGSGAEKIVDILINKKNVNEFLISKKLDATINQARNILYKLSEHGVVTFIRKKDKKSGGWYTYFWTLNVGKSFQLYRERILEEVRNIENHMGNRKTKQFYNCSYCGLEISEEESLLHDFICPECGEVFQLKNTDEEVVSLEKNILKLTENLSFVDKEIDDFRKKEEMSRERRVKKELKLKKEEREKKRKKLQKERLAETKKKTRKSKTIGKKKSLKSAKKTIKKIVRKSIKKNVMKLRKKKLHKKKFNSKIKLRKTKKGRAK